MFFQKLAGIILDATGLLQLGKNGTNIKYVDDATLEFRNEGDTQFAVVRGAAPVGDNDFVTKAYADKLPKPVIVDRQADTSSSLPNNTAVRGHVVVTTPGTGAVIGDLLFDDGSNSGTMEILPAVDGQMISVTQTLSGGTISFDANALYTWDATGGAWIKIGDVGGLSGAVRRIRWTFTNAAVTDAGTQIPAGAFVHDAQIKITTPFPGGATLELGRASDSDLLQDADCNIPQKPAGSIFQTEQDTAWGTAAVPRVTTNSPASGAGVAIVEYSIPDN